MMQTAAAAAQLSLGHCTAALPGVCVSVSTPRAPPYQLECLGSALRLSIPAANAFLTFLSSENISVGCKCCFTVMKT